MKIASSEIKTVYIESIQLSDVNQNYVNWLNDPEVNKYLETRHVKQDLTSVQNFVSEMSQNPQERLFKIVTQEAHLHIGNIKLGKINAIHGTADISLFIGDKKYWGQGVATDVIRLISRYAFNELNIRKLVAGAYKPNQGSINAFKKVGFQIECELSKHFILDNQACDSVQLCMFADKKSFLPQIVVS